MSQGHGDRPLPHRGRYPLQISAPNVPDREYPGQVGLEQVRGAAQGPPHEILGSQVPARLDEALVIERNAASSQRVFGTAPAMTNRCLMEELMDSSLPESRQVTFSR